MEKINFVFWGTPDVASETLEILKEAGFLPSLIVTSPDAPAGRKLVLTPPPAKIWAEKNKILFVQPESPAELGSFFSKDELVIARGSEKKMSAAETGFARGVEKNLQEAELFIVVAYGKIIPERILQFPKFGSINIHYSLLPKYRGASPVETAVLNGDKETGVTIQKMVFKLDAGDILAQENTEINPDETAPELRKRLIKLGGEMLVKFLQNPNFEGQKQNDPEATHSGKIKKDDGLIDLNDDSVKNYNKYRAYYSWPRTFFFKDGKRIIITEAALENNQFVIKKVIPEGGKEIPYKN
jgi:methionyl-tRNA formyltransferase